LHGGKRERGKEEWDKERNTKSTQRKTSMRFKKKRELFNDVTHLFDGHYMMFVSDGNGSEIKANTVNKSHQFLFIEFTS